MDELPIIQHTYDLIKSYVPNRAACGLLAFRRALFCARVDAWECIERAKEESRPVPAISVTVSKYQTGWGSLVGSPKNYPIF